MKRVERSWFTAVLASGVLRARRGATRIVVTLSSPIEERQTREAHRLLVANRGDRLLAVAGEGIAILEVVSVKQDGWEESLVVKQNAGSVADGALLITSAKGLVA